MKRLTNRQIEKVKEMRFFGICYCCHLLNFSYPAFTKDQIKIFGKKFPPTKYKGWHLPFPVYSWPLNERGMKNRVAWLRSCKRKKK